MATISTAACARALREPPPLELLARGGIQSAGEAQAACDRADALYASRPSVEPVREASDLWLKAASLNDPDRADLKVRALGGAARAGVWLTDHEAESAARLRAATTAVQAAQWCGRIAPGEPACDYWLGAALGVQARERPSTGLSALPEIEAAFKRAASTSPELEEAGPDRALALLYLRAPGWPSGPGDPDLGLEHARKAVASRPDYPPNELALAEALAATGAAEESFAACGRALERARTLQSAGDPDAAEWIAEANSMMAARSAK